MPAHRYHPAVAHPVVGRRGGLGPVLRAFVVSLALLFLGIGLLAAIDTRRSVDDARRAHRVRRAAPEAEDVDVVAAAAALLLNGSTGALLQTPHDPKCDVQASFETHYELEEGYPVHTFSTGVRVYVDEFYGGRSLEGPDARFHSQAKDFEFVKLIRQSKPCEAYIDIGGGNCYYAILALKINPQLKVRIFNPGTPFRRSCRRNFHLNGLSMESAQVKQYPYAVHAGSNSKRLLQPGSAGVIKSAGKVKKKERAEMETVRAISFDRWRSKYGKDLGAVALMQVDIPGLEADVVDSLKTATLKRVNTIMLATHSEKAHDACKRHLMKDGLVITVEFDGLIVAKKVAASSDQSR